MGKKVEDYMKDISKIVVTMETSMIDVMRKMVEQNSQAIVVADSNHELEGIITGSDIIRELERAIDSSRLRDGRAEHVMTSRGKLAKVPEGTLMIEALEVMFRERRHSLVITKNFSPTGILTQTDIVKWWLEEHSVSNES